MTAQVGDGIELDGEDYTLAGIAPSEGSKGLFDPSQHGLRPISPHTANWRGFVAGYAIVDGALVLARLEISLAGADLDAVLGPRPLLGKKPTRVDRWQSAPGNASLEYEDLGAVDFSGGLLAARDFIRELYVHMGFHPAWKYRKVHELLVEHGRVVARFDRSEAIAAMRQRFATAAPQRAPANMSPPSREELERWIAGTFRRDYELGLGFDSA